MKSTVAMYDALDVQGITDSKNDRTKVEIVNQI